MCFYDNLSELCKINGITVSGLLAELKMSASNKQKWQNGATVNSSVLMKIADYFNVSVDYLLGRTDNSTVLSESYIGGDNNGIQAIKNRGSVTIRQTAEKENNCKEIEVLLEKNAPFQTASSNCRYYRFVGRKISGRIRKVCYLCRQWYVTDADQTMLIIMDIVRMEIQDLFAKIVEELFKFELIDT